MPITECLIWKPSVDEDEIPWDLSDMAEVLSERAGGRYRMSIEAFRRVRGMEDSEKARLTTWLVDQRSLGITIPVITTEVVGYTRNRGILPAHERAERLLRFLVERTDTVGTGVDVNWTTLAAFAWSESVVWEEVVFLLNYLRDRGWLDHTGTNNRIFPDTGLARGVVTMVGYSQIAEVARSVDSAQCFVAMWFNPETEKAYVEGIAPGIENAGYKALRVDLEHYSEKIDDKIIAEIRRSRFLVADMTHGNDGARGSVYFEAGFALGLGIHVIYTCRDDMFASLHFDTRQYPHIGWKVSEFAELQAKLEDRIRAVIGAGPYAVG